MELNLLAKTIHENAVDKGFYDKKKEVGTLLMLIVSELGEAMEADRKGRHATGLQVNTYLCLARTEHDKDKLDNSFKSSVKDTFEDEIADALIRILDMCAYMNIDIESHVIAKMDYNKRRQRLHGKQY